MKQTVQLVFAFAIMAVCLHDSASKTDAQALPLAGPKHSLTLKIDGKRTLPFNQPGSPNIVRATTHDGTHIDVSFNKDATEVTLSPPEGSDRVRILTAEESTQFADGTLVFSALDAKVVGARARLETHPGSHRIGFWSNEDDYVTWSFKPKRWGNYDVELLYSQAGPSGNEIEATLGLADDGQAPLNKALSATLESTGSWYTYRVAKLGQLYIDDHNFRRQLTLKVGSKKKVANAVMNLKAVLLRPACEGERMISADGSGKLIFHSKDSTVCGIQLVYEPNPRKNTLGWWVVPTDKARWAFTLDEPGTFDVNVLQGCGEGQGGSRVAVEVLKEDAPTIRGSETEAEQWTVARVDFDVEDTGHFQNYISRSVGRFDLSPGKYILQVRPLGIAKNAVMDLRELSLKPAKE